MGGVIRTLAMPLLFAAALSAQVPAHLPPFSTFLKANSTIKQVATDAHGFIYVFGETNTNPKTGYAQDVFVARLDPATANPVWTANLGGSGIVRATALALDSAGNAYVTGFTEAPDFPTLPAAPNPANSGTDVTFVAKVNAGGQLAYSVLFANGISAYPQAIAVDNNGDAIVSGTAGNLPATPGAYNNAWTTALPFVTKLDPTGTKPIFTALGVGGSQLALDSTGNIYIAGTTGAFGQNPPLYPTTPGAFQTTYTPITVCPPTPCFFPTALGQQYVSKLSADGTKLLYSTFVTGSRGSYNAGLAVDASGDVWLTGDTASPDYPYTQSTTAASLNGTFTTELDPTGSKVLLSVAEGVPPGNGNHLAFDPQGNLVEVGNFPILPETTFPPNVLPAPTPPSTANIPSACAPGEGIYLLNVSSQDGSLLGMQILPGSGQIASAVDSQGNVYVSGAAGLPNIPLTPGVVYDAAVALRTVAGAFLERTNFAIAPSALGCVTDAPNMSLIGPVAPGQLITLYGNSLFPFVTFDGRPAAILYASSTQINLQVPFDVASNSSTVMQMAFNGTVLANRTFVVTPLNPSLFVSSVATNLFCGNVQAGGSVLIAFALNQDGSVNSCANPARGGSRFTLFVNGIGVTSPEFIRGPTALFDGALSLEVDSFTSQPNAIAGIGQITARVPDTILGLEPMYVTMSANGLPAGPLTPGGGENPPGATEVPVVVFVEP